MTVWDILGIDETYDVALLKKAYAAQLKLHRPDKDPAGYQQLREAYERARSYAQDVVQDALAEPESATMNVVANPLPSLADEEVAEVAPDPEELFFYEFLDSVDQLLEQGAGLSNPEAWYALVSAPELDSFDMRQALSFQVFARVADHCVTQKIEVWVSNARLSVFVLADKFSWQDSELELQRYFDVESVDAVMGFIGGEGQRVNEPTSDLNQTVFGMPKWLALTLFWLGLLFVFGLFTGYSDSNSGGAQARAEILAERALEKVQEALDAGEYAQAEGQLDRMIEQAGPLLVPTVAMRYQLHAKNSQYDAGLQLLNRHLKLEENPGLLFYRSRSLGQLGQLEAARVDLLRAGELAGRNANILNWVAWELAIDANATTVERELALSYALRASDLTDRENAAVLDTLAAAYATIGEYENALKTQRQAVDAWQGEIPEHIVERVELYKRGEPYHE